MLSILAEASSTSGSGIAATGTITVGASVVSAIVTYLATKRHAEETRVPQPLEHEQTANQAAWKSNATDHANYEARLRSLEMKQSELAGTVTAKISMIERQLDNLSKMISTMLDMLGEKMR